MKAQRAAAPFLKRAAAPIVQRVQAYSRRWHWPARRGEATDARAYPRPVPPAPSGAVARPPDEREDGTGQTVDDGRDSAAPSEPARETEKKDEATRSASSPEEAAVTPAGNLPPRLPAVRASPPLPPALRALQVAAEAHPSAVAYRRLADAAAAGYPEVAADAYRREAQIYRRLGDPNAASVEELKAGRYRAEGRLYLHAPEPPPSSLNTRQRLEPPYGALLGAFIDRDDQLPETFLDENWQTHRDAADFEERVGKKHASLFCYLRYGQKFPFRWAERLREAGIIPHIAWEPRSLAEVNDDATLSRFADALARFDAPIFIRFAGEMNGEWTPYHGNPALYRQKFRLVHQVLARRAPKAAMIWCMNSVPEAGIEVYYPGDDAVDWVGVNLYNVLYFDNDRRRPADRVHPADLLQPIYSRYASRKPIALCEYAASHQAAVDPRPRPEIAITRLAQMYGALPRLFPRVKLVDWFDCNNLRHARPDRQLNDYSLTDDSNITSAYREAVAPGYFRRAPDDHPGETIRGLRDDEPVSGVVTFSAWFRSHLDRPRVYLLADDQVLYAGDLPGPPVCRWDTRRARPGGHQIRLLVIDNDGRKILDERCRVRVAAGS